MEYESQRLFLLCAMAENRSGWRIANGLWLIDSNWGSFSKKGGQGSGLIFDGLEFFSLTLF